MGNWKIENKDYIPTHVFKGRTTQFFIATQINIPAQPKVEMAPKGFIALQNA